MKDDDVEKIIKRNMNLQINLAGIRADFEEASQRTWVGLSDAEIHNMTILMGFNPEWVTEVEMVKSIVRNLEAKLKEKNA